MTGKPIRFFVSFSSRDLDAARDIFDRLKYQGFDVWDYSNEVQSIEAGTRIDERLYREIDRCDFFLAVISHSSVDPSTGKFTRAEVEYAINKGLLVEGRIIPVFLSDRFNGILTGPFAALAPYKHEDFIRANIDSLVDLMIAICLRTGKEHIPFVKPHPRLPFWELFREEVTGLGKMLKNHYYLELTRTISEFTGYYLKGDFETAHLLVTHFINSCKWRLPDYRPVYPYIVKAVCEQDLGLNSHAGQSYLTALAHQPHNPDALGGLGVIEMATGRFRDSARHFLEASMKSAGKQVENERLNYITAKSLIPGMPSEEEIRFMLEYDVSGYLEEERRKILALKAIVCHQTRDYLMADRFFTQIGMKNIPDPNSAIYYYLNLKALGNSYRKLKDTLLLFIETERYQPSKKRFLIELGDLHFSQGDLNAFRDVYENHLLKGNSKNRDVMVRYIRMLKRTGIKTDVEKAEKLCRNYFSLFSGSLPATASDYYYDGFVWYLLGNHERAQYDYERSGGFDTYYKNYETPFDF